MFGFTSMSVYIKYSAVAEQLSLNHRKKKNAHTQTPALKSPGANKWGKNLFILSHEFHRLVRLRVPSLTAIEVAQRYSRAALWVM